MKELENKVALVTGAASGIGKAVAALLARIGVRVAVSDINEKEGLLAVAEITEAKGDAYFIKADTSKPSDHQQLVQETLEHYSQLDIAINNAGIGGALALTGEYPLESWQRVIDINLSGVFYGMRYQLPAMQKNGGSIVNIASILGQVGTRLSPAYVASKHGVVGLTKAAALEYATSNIRINSIGPGYITTPLLTNSLSADAMNSLTALHPMGRLGVADEVAELVVWLASPKASFITGSYYAVDGGYLAQ